MLIEADWFCQSAPTSLGRANVICGHTCLENGQNQRDYGIQLRAPVGSKARCKRFDISQFWSFIPSHDCQIVCTSHISCNESVRAFVAKVFKKGWHENDDKFDNKNNNNNQEMIMKKQARKPRATLVWNYDSLTDLLTRVKCRATSVAKNKWFLLRENNHCVHTPLMYMTMIIWSTDHTFVLKISSKSTETNSLQKCHHCTQIWHIWHISEDPL